MKMDLGGSAVWMEEGAIPECCEGTEPCCVVRLTCRLAGTTQGARLIFQARPMTMKRRSAWGSFTGNPDEFWMPIDGSLPGCPYGLEAVTEFLLSFPRLESHPPAHQVVQNTADYAWQTETGRRLNGSFGLRSDVVSSEIHQPHRR